MKKIHVLSFVCLIFFACDTEVSNSPSNNEQNGTANLSSSLEFTSSSSLEVRYSSSSSERNPGIPLCKTYNINNLTRDTTVYFNKQGGIDTIVTGMSIRFENFSERFPYLDFNKYEYLAQCEFSLTDHYVYDYTNYTYDKYGKVYSRIKIESDYCKNNYCVNDLEGTHSSSPDGVPVMKIECPWFSVTRISKDSVQVSVNKNETGKERSQYIPFTTTGCALSIVDFKITQTSTP
jgi:hypothetical protein